MNEIYEIVLKALNIELSKDKLDNFYELSNSIGFDEALAQILNKTSRINLEPILLELYRKQRISITQISENFGLDIKTFLKTASIKFELTYIDIDTIGVDYRLSQKISITILKQFEAVPYDEDTNYVYIAFKNPFDLTTQDKLQSAFDNKILKISVCDPTQIDRHLSKIELNQSIKDLVAQIRNELSTTNEINDGNSAILNLIDVILKTAITNRASDIHIEPTQINCIVRCRIDGILNETFVFDSDIYAPLLSRIKLLSNLDIAQKRKPQDGRFSTKILDKDYDFRVSTLPTINGESLVMRILDKSKVIINLENLGMSETNLIKFNQALQIPYGIILVTGPTGCGKTTTLYAALNSVKSIKNKVITVEDPVEYQLSLTQQVSVNEKIGLSFAVALRSILRQDPDTIMIGEIRDQQTLQIGIQAALTGHLVFSTLHTNNSILAITRMIDMGIESYLVSGSIIAIEAQRLIRKLCPHCKAKTTLPENLKSRFSKILPNNYQFYRHTGCSKCSQTGYLGREMISEVLIVNDKIQSLIAANASKDELLKAALDNGFIDMLSDGILKAASGITSIEEIFRVVK